jgi:hypothetical protein
MTSLSHEPARAAPEKAAVSFRFLAREAWASIAITAMWIAVVVDAIVGPDIHTSSSGGSDTATIPSAVAVAFFAFLGTWAVAKYGLGRRRDD